MIHRCFYNSLTPESVMLGVIYLHTDIVNANGNFWGRCWWGAHHLGRNLYILSSVQTNLPVTSSHHCCSIIIISTTRSSGSSSSLEGIEVSGMKTKRDKIKDTLLFYVWFEMAIIVSSSSLSTCNVCYVNKPREDTKETDVVSWDNSSAGFKRKRTDGETRHPKWVQ